MHKYLNQVHSFQKLRFRMRNVLTLLYRQISMMSLWSSILSKMPEYGFFHTKAWLLPAKTWKNVLHSCAKFLGCRNSKIFADFFPVDRFSLQQEIQEKEVLQDELIQVVSEKKVVQHGLLLRSNVEGVKLEVAHCLKLEAVHCLPLRIQCETVTSRVFQALSQTILILRLVQMFFFRRTSEDRLQWWCLCIGP